MQKPRLLLLALLLSAAPILAGCQTMTAGAATECRIFRPITWSRQDTDPTVRQVKSHNAAGKAACGWR